VVLSGAITPVTNLARTFKDSFTAAAALSGCCFGGRGKSTTIYMYCTCERKTASAKQDRAGSIRDLGTPGTVHSSGGVSP